MENRINVNSHPGARRKSRRKGRGAGSNRGSTCGRGDKGQNSRSGGGVRAGFEGGQMPLRRRLPKRGFHSLTADYTAEVRLSELTKFDGQTVDLEVLKKNRIIPKRAERAKVIVSGSLDAKVTLKGLAVSAGARAEIESQLGQVLEN